MGDPFVIGIGHEISAWFPTTEVVGAAGASGLNAASIVKTSE
jgi:hypothetical protein